MPHIRRRRFREASWYACYLAMLSLTLAVMAERPVTAQNWCPTNGTSNCGMVLTPCPWQCYNIQIFEDTYGAECQSTVCRRGYCMFYAWEGWSGMGCMLCTVESFSHCICCGES